MLPSMTLTTALSAVGRSGASRTILGVTAAGVACSSTCASSSSSSSSYQTASTSSRPFSTSSSLARGVVRPAPSLPASQAAAGTTAPRDVLDLITRYPRHPLLAFFNNDVRKVDSTLVSDGASSSSDGKKKSGASSSKTTEVEVPVSLSLTDLSKDRIGRAWMAPELRLKSSFELHQLWYICLIERNKLATSWEELKRVGGRGLARMSNVNLGLKNRKLRKTMARIKFVLNERRLALMEAQALARQEGGAAPTAERSPVSFDGSAEKGGLYE